MRLGQGAESYCLAEEWCATTRCCFQHTVLPSDCRAHREPHLVGRAAATSAGTAHCLAVCAVALLLCPPCSPAWERAAVAQVPPPPPSGIFEDSPHVAGKAVPRGDDPDWNILNDQVALQLQHKDKL